MAFKRNPRHVRDGELVNASVAGRATREVQGNAVHLYDLVNSLGLGQSLVLRDASLAPEAGVGWPVYYNKAASRFEPALCATEVDQATGRIATSASGRVWGVVLSKATATLGVLLLSGYAKLDISGALADDETPVAGDYWLSGVTAGRLTPVRPAVSVLVLRADNAGGVLVKPSWDSLEDAHVHFRFDLVCAPAGANTIADGRHAVTSPDPDLEGWLPAGHAVFAGKAPAGAVFGYNLSADDGLRNAWPPLPLQTALLELDRGDDAALGFQGVPQGSDGLAVLDQNGVWWMSDCLGDVPWPTEYATSEASEESDDPDAECPRTLRMACRVWFTRPGFLTETTAVTSIRSSDARLKVECDGKPGVSASVGRLVVSLDLQFQLSDADHAGASAVKGIGPDNQTLLLGPVVSRIRSSSIAVTGADHEDGGKYGDVTLEVENFPDRELPAAIARLEGATEEFYRGIPYLALPSGKASSIDFVFHVPASTPFTGPFPATLNLRALALAAGVIPPLDLEYRILPAAGSPTALPGVSTVLPLTTGDSVSADEYVDLESDPVNVNPGDDLVFRLSRDASVSDGLAGDLGVLRLSCRLAQE